MDNATRTHQSIILFLVILILVVQTITLVLVAHFVMTGRDMLPKQVTIPDVVGLRQAHAERAFEQTGLVVETSTVYSDEAPGGIVLAQFPEAGARIDSEVTVHLTISYPISLGAEKTLLLPGDVPLDLVWIPPGEFMMGSPQHEKDRWIVEGPQHLRTIESFWMGRYTVTKLQWEAVMGTRPWAGQGNVLDHSESPAVYVSWHDAHEFITELNAHLVATGQGSKTMRLPSEAEWEYAARAGTITRFYWGDDPNYTQIYDHAWWEGNAKDVGKEYAHIVGQKLLNPWGLYDMAGNVSEWCEDHWHDGYNIGTPSDGSAWVDVAVSSNPWNARVLKGGNWSSRGGSCRSAMRGVGRVGWDPHEIIGFRLAGDSRLSVY